MSHFSSFKIFLAYDMIINPNAYLEEEDDDESHQKKLDLNAPFLSTKKRRTPNINGMAKASFLDIMPRPSSIRVSRDEFCDQRVPFSWEQSPGKPKHFIQATRRNNDDSNGINVGFRPPPKLPPCWWISEKEIAVEGEVEEVEVEVEVEKEEDRDYDGEFDGNVKDYGNDEVDQSDAIDLFSLGQSTDMIEPGDEVQMFGFSGLEAKEYVSESHSPNFIIQRFLPDAKALAASSSAINLSNTINEDPPELSTHANNRGVSRALSVRQSYPTTKGCGLNSFFPWRMRSKPCATKNPVVVEALKEKIRIRCTRRNK